MLFYVTHALYRENHRKYTGTLCGQNADFNTLKKVVNRVTTEFEGSNIAARAHTHTNVM
jgi:hypothetical protein